MGLSSPPECLMGSTQVCVQQCMTHSRVGGACYSIKPLWVATALPLPLPVVKVEYLTTTFHNFLDPNSHSLVTWMWPKQCILCFWQITWERLTFRRWLPLAIMFSTSCGIDLQFYIYAHWTQINGYTQGSLSKFRHFDDKMSGPWKVRPL
jgi:hypothetical protein